jgi:hypothetical protein
MISVMGRRTIVICGVALIAVATAFACGDNGPGALDNGQTLPPGTTPTQTGTATSPTGTVPKDGAAPGTDGAAPGTDSGTSAARDLSTDRNKFFGASRCAGSGLLLCEDFESGSVDKNVWTVVGQQPTVDAVQAARGTKALHISVTGNGASYLKEQKTFPAPNNTYWGRAFVYFNQIPKPDPDAGFTYAHWTFAAASGTGVKGEIRLSGQLQSPGNIFGVGTDSTPAEAGTGDWTTSDNDPAGSPKVVPTKSWLCIEWLHSGQTNETRFFWDAAEHTSLHTTSTKHGGNQANPYIMPTFTNAWVGWQEYQATAEPFEMWVDEIAIDGARIGCVM